MLAVGLTVGTPYIPTAEARCADVRVPLRNLKLEAKWVDKTVRVGETAVLKVRVSRTADEDPVTDEGIPYPTGRPMNEPVEDVELGLGLFVGNVYLNGGALSDTDGRAKVPVQIRSFTRPGRGSTSLYGEKRHTPPDFPSPSCRVVVFEWGELNPGPNLEVIP